MGEWRAAARELKQAVTRGPGLAEAHATLGRLLSEIGALDEGTRRLEAALALDPKVPLACDALARCYESASHINWDGCHYRRDIGRFR